MGLQRRTIQIIIQTYFSFENIYFKDIETSTFY